MKTQGKIWIIYDVEEKKQSKPMSVVQAQVALLALDPDSLDKYHLWTPGWAEWICVSEFLMSEQTYFVGKRPPKPVPEDSITVTQTQIESSINKYTEVALSNNPMPSDPYGYYAPDFNGDQLDLSKIRKIKPAKADSTKKKGDSRKIERRQDIRHEFKIEVVLVSKSKSFRTFSKNISLGGTLLEKEVPREFLNSPFDLVIVNPFEIDPKKSRLHFQARIVGDMRDPRRLMFFEQDPKMTSRLEALLKAYMTYQKSIKKTAG
jgi:hypothetical protein